MQDAIDWLWCEGGAEAERVLRALRRLLDALYPTDRSIAREDRTPTA